MADNEFKYDVRLMDHHLRRNVLTRVDVQSHLQSLADDAEHGEETETHFTPTYERRGQATNNENQEG